MSRFWLLILRVNAETEGIRSDPEGVPVRCDGKAILSHALEVHVRSMIALQILDPPTAVCAQDDLSVAGRNRRVWQHPVISARCSAQANQRLTGDIDDP